MGLAQDIDSAVKQIVRASWNSRDGTVVPTTENVALSNGAVLLDAVYLYADMADSTGLARNFSKETAAKVIRAYLDATCRVIKARGGEIRSFDGDRVMAIFVGDAKNSSAAKCGLNIKYVVDEIVRPAVENRFPSLVNNGFTLTHCVGIASGSALIVRGGVRGSNDLVSVGRPPNVAAKLSEVRTIGYTTYITLAYSICSTKNPSNEESKYGPDRRLMWDQQTRTVGGEVMTVYRSLALESMSDSDALDNAWKIHGVLTDWTGKADAKASFALTIESAFLGGVIAFSNRDRVLGQLHEAVPLLLHRAGTVVLAVAILCAVAAVIPQIRSRPARRTWRENFVYSAICAAGIHGT